MNHLQQGTLRRAALLGGLLAGLTLSLHAQAPAHPEMLVSTAWLAEHLKDPKVVVLHIAESRKDYDRGHVPGARFLATDKFIVGHTGLMAELPPEDQLKRALEEVGVSDDSRVVLYTTDWYPMAGRGYFTLDYLGHGDKSALLDGGFQQWQAEKRAISTESVSVAKGSFTPNLHPKVRAVLGEVKDISNDQNAQTLLVDSRPRGRYTDGHIPGATHVYWRETVVSEKKPVLLPIEDLRALFKSRGITSGHPLVTYCEVGLQASHVYFVAKYLGYGDAMYDGSYHEWVHVENLPVVTGDSKR